MKIWKKLKRIRENDMKKNDKREEKESNPNKNINNAKKKLI